MENIFPVYEDSFKSTDKIDLYHLTDSFSSQLPDECVVVTDSGLIELIIPNNLNFQKNRRIVHPASQGSMGFALPAVIGAHYSSNIPVVAVIGDGSIMMNLQELEAISYNEIPAKIFVVNNNVYSVIRKRQIEMFRSRTIGTDPSDGVSCPDFKKVASTFNFNYMTIKSNQGLDEKIKSVFEVEGPVLCEIMEKKIKTIFIVATFVINIKRL